jgi:hypothetical protein
MTKKKTKLTQKYMNASSGLLLILKTGGKIYFSMGKLLKTTVVYPYHKKLVSNKTSKHGREQS